MKCGNPNCKYELFEQEEEYFICPHCAGIIENNISNNIYYDDIYEVSSYYLKKISIINKAKKLYYHLQL